MKLDRKNTEIAPATPTPSHTEKIKQYIKKYSICDFFIITFSTLIAHCIYVYVTFEIPQNTFKDVGQIIDQKQSRGASSLWNDRHIYCSTNKRVFCRATKNSNTKIEAYKIKSGSGYYYIAKKVIVEGEIIHETTNRGVFATVFSIQRDEAFIWIFFLFFLVMYRLELKNA